MVLLEGKRAHRNEDGGSNGITWSREDLPKEPEKNGEESDGTKKNVQYPGAL